MAREGWIMLHRCIWDCELWVEETPFDDRSAWIDLLLVCTRSTRRVRFGKEVIDLAPGEYVTSQHRLASRWHWSRKKVSNYLKVLEKLGQITTRKVGLWFVITVVKYTEYQSISTASEPLGNHLGTSMAPVENHLGTTKQEDKEDKERDREGNLSNIETTVVQQQSFPQPVDKCAKAVLELSTLFLGGLTAFQAEQARQCITEVGVDIFAEAVKRSRGKAQTPNYVFKTAYGLLDGDDYKRPRKNDVAAGYKAAMEGDLDDAGF